MTTEPPDRLTEIEQALATEQTYDPLKGCGCWNDSGPILRLCLVHQKLEDPETVRWLVAELRAAREQLEHERGLRRNYQGLANDRLRDERRYKAELAAAHRVIQVARELADEAREHIAVPDRYPLPNVEEALVGLDRALAAFDANHPAAERSPSTPSA